MKTYFAQKLGVEPEKIYTVSVMPCVAKKGEREMELFYEEYAGHDIDAVITTREPVSYTHLDVYKRQDPGRPGGEAACGTWDCL